MRIEKLPTASIIPYEFNNRKHPDNQIDRIANSIVEFGFNQPIVVDEQSIVLVGHGRLLAAKKLGLKEVPVFIASGLTEAKKKAYRILDNKLQNDSEWDFENLKIELDQLKDMGFDLEEWDLGSLSNDFKDDLSDEYKDGMTHADLLLISVECDNESKQAQLFDELKGRGFKCKLL